MRVQVRVESKVEETARVDQVRGMFDIEDRPVERVEWEAELPLECRPWSIGLIVGPSGCGKSTIARHLWPEECSASASLSWSAGKSLLDSFPEELPIKDVVAALSSVGFSSPPAWLRPFQVLSTGQQFRVTLARLLCGSSRLVIFDEYTSVVDRTVAQVGSAAVARAVRERGKQFVAVTCHEDVLEWLQPDWVYRPDVNEFTWRLLRRRPAVGIAIFRCEASAWKLFSVHHYLSHSCNRSATCFLATWKGRTVAFSAWLPFVGTGKKSRREHRTVTLPDYQGVGIGNAVSNTVAAMWKTLRYVPRSTTTHPGMIAYRRRSPLWRMTREPSLAGVEGKGRMTNLGHATTRLTAGFEYVGPGLSKVEARSLLGE